MAILVIAEMRLIGDLGYCLRLKRVARGGKLGNLEFQTATIGGFLASLFSLQGALCGSFYQSGIGVVVIDSADTERSVHIIRSNIVDNE